MNEMNEIYIKNISFALNPNRVAEFFDMSKLRRMDNLSKLSLYCAAKLLKQEGIDFEKEKDDIGLIIVSGRGPLVQTCNFMDGIIDFGALYASPLSFCGSIHNAIETAITINLNFRGPCLTISQGASSFESALITARSYLMSKRVSAVLLGAADEANPVALKEYPQKIIFKQCAAFFLLKLAADDDSITPHRLLSQIESRLKGKRDEFNPSICAFNAARELAPLLLVQDCKKIINDIIKTTLASKKKQTLSVFDNKDIFVLNSEIDFEQKLLILERINSFFALNFSLDDINDGFQIAAEKCAANSKEKGIAFFTSGSLGEPKSCPHNVNMIKEEAGGVSFLFKSIKRIISLVPAHHSYGFIFGGQLGKFMDLETLYYPPLPNLQWDNILKDGDLFITFPLFLNYLKELDFKFPKGITVLTSTAPCPDDLIDFLYKNGVENVIEIYGSSETGAIGYRQEAGSPFNLLPFWHFADQDGSKIERNTQKEIELPDIIERLSSETFFVKGRKDQGVQVAGINVYPKKVEEILKKHPFIKDVSARLGDKRLKAFIVLKDGICREDAEKEINKYINENLTAHEAPQNIIFGGSIPINALGKKTDWQ